MNLREAISEYVVGHLQCHEVIGMDGDGVERIRRQAFAAGERLDRVVEVAEAAIAYAEYRMDNEHDAPVDGATYIRERGKLWEAFLEARARAKGIEQ